MKHTRIIAVVVTHNRSKLVSRCIDYILMQERPVDEILVVNNGSTDGTVEMLHRRGINFVTQENVGSAGGWHTGIQQALYKGFDAVWLMDDDGFPEIGALAALEVALVPGVACASSIVVREEDPTTFVFPFPVLDEARMPVIFGLPRKYSKVAELRQVSKDGTYHFVHLFNGALVSLKSLAQFGNVNRDYFIYGEEVDYFFRMRKTGSVISVLDAIHFHPNVSERPLNEVKVYYYIKNSMILNSLYFNAVWFRHFLILMAVLSRMASRNGMRFVFSMLIGRNSTTFYSAILRGIKGNLGADFHG